MTTRTVFLVIFSACLGAGASAVSAYEPPIREIVTRFLENKSATTRAIIHSRSMVFDPFAAPAPAGEAGAEADQVVATGVGEDERLPVLQPERGFRQVTYWVRDIFLAVETFSLEGELLHFYLSETFRPISVNLHPERNFTDSDVLHPYLPFTGESAQGWWEGLDRWGLRPTAVEIVRVPKGGIFYRLVESEGKALWVERENHLPLRIETLIEGGEAPTPLTIEFSDFLLFGETTEDVFFFPGTINYLIDGKLFKQTRVRRMESNPSWRNFPLTRLRNKGRELLAEQARGPLPTGVH